jgi:hypothetical protein
VHIEVPSKHGWGREESKQLNGGRGRTGSTEQRLQGDLGGKFSHVPLQGDHVCPSLAEWWGEC